MSTMKVCLVNRYFDFRGTGVTRIATEVSRELERRGHEVVKAATSGNSLYAYAWHTGIKIAFTLPRDGIDVYHALATLEAMWLPPEKSIATYLDLFTTTNPDRAGAGMGYSRWKLEIGRRYFALGARVARRCRFLVCISEKTRQDVLEYVGADERKLRVIRLGISDTLKPEQREHKRFTIGTLGQLDRRKRLGLLVRAFHKSRIDADLVIAGQGPDHEILRNMAGRDLRIRFLGLVPENELNAFYNSLSVFCLTARTIVFTSGGYKEIKSIKVGDRVLTHTGEYQRVARLFKRPYKGEYIAVDSNYLPGRVHLTPEHPVMVLKQDQVHDRAKLVNASELTENDYVFIPRPKMHLRKFSMSITNRQYCPTSTKKLPYRIKFTPAFFRLLGCYISEGSTSSDGVVFSLSSKTSDDELEMYVHEAVAEISDKINVITKHMDRNRRVVRVYNRRLGTILRRHFGKEAHNKRIPEEVLQLCDQDNILIPQLIKALWMGDGSCKGSVFQYSTVSKKLIYQLYTLLLRHNILATMQYNKTHKWSLAIAGKSAIRFSELTSLTLSKTPVNIKRRWLSGDYGFWVPIKRVCRTKSGPTGCVYNLEVENDNTYTANFVVHNCFPTGIEGYGLPAVEAMACGKPVVVLDDAILPQEIRGRCVSVPDLESFFGNNGVLDVKVDYAGNLAFAGEHRWDKCVSEYIKLYEEIKEAN